MKKQTTLLLTLLLLASTVLGACSGETSSDPNGETTAAQVNTEPPETEAQKIEPDLPDITYDGRDYRIYSWYIEPAGVGAYWVWDDVWVEAQNGEVINDAVFQRNSYVEEKFDIAIQYKNEFYINYEENVKKSVKANEDLYDVILSMGHCIPRMYTSNVFYNLHDIDYLDFDKPWWDANATEAFTLAGYMPFAVSDMTILDKGATACVFFNKKIAEDYGVGNLYEHVYNNTWTMDTLITEGKKVSEDLNGDSIYDENDRYGIVCGDEPVYMFFHAADGRYVTKDADGYPVFTFESESNYSAIQYYLENIMYDERLTFNATYNDYKNWSSTLVNTFIENKALFMVDLIRDIESLRSMESDFGILPIPKYSASQDHYSSSASVFGGNLISVPITCTDTDFVGIILEALSAESTYTLIPAFYDTVLKDKATRDVESTDMLDIIIESRVYDVGDFFNIVSFPDLFLRITGSVHDNGISSAYPKRTSDVASFYAKYEKSINKELEKLIEIIDEWNEM